jgi:hypothetical protein
MRTIFLGVARAISTLAAAVVLLSACAGSLVAVGPR